MSVSLFPAFSCVGGCRADDEAEVAWGRCGCPEVLGVSPGHVPACLVPGVSWVVQGEVGPCPVPGRAMPLSLHAGSSVCFPFPGGINRKDCFPKPLISSSLYLLLLTCIESVLLVQKMRILLRGKNALSKEGEEDILVLGWCSVLPLILTLVGEHLNHQPVWLGELQSKNSCRWGWVWSQAGSRSCCTVAVWPFAPSITGCLKSVSSKLSLKFQVYVVYSTGKEAVV